MELLLDSNVFRSKPLLQLILETQVSAYIPLIVELEQYFYALLKGKTSTWNRISKDLSLSVINLTKADARLAAEFSQNFIKHPKGPAYFFRDCLIAATSINRGLLLVTDNLKDFTYLNENQVISVMDCIKLLRT